MSKSLVLLLVLSVNAAAVDLKLWYDKPAVDWQKETLPIGNGRLGAMIFGGVPKERIQFNEDSLWIGDEVDTGAYQAFGDLYLDFDQQAPTAYRRELDIERAVQTITYSSGGTSYQRQYFASHPANVMVFRFTADKPGALTGTLTLTDAHKGTIIADGNRVTAKGNLAGYTHSLSGKNAKYNIALDYEAQVVAQNEGGKVKAKDNKLVFTGVTTLTVFLDAGTDFVQDRSKGWRGAHPHAAITERLEKAAATAYSDLLDRHIKDYQGLFGRLNLDLGTSPDTVRSLSTDKRLRTYQQADTYSKHPIISPDPELEAMLFQYGRYLMISSSRPGDLPATLQGVWNNSNNPAWRCDYHSDINVQMNYWFVDVANLPGCFEPYSEWLWSVIPVRRDATKKQFGTRGWATRSENGIFGGATYHWVPGDAAWLAQNIWDHYAFTQDEKYLATRAYPIIKELCEFWEDFLKERPDGKLVSPKSQSPEHGPFAEGNSYEQQLVYDLFTNYIEASKALGVDEEFRKKVETMRRRLLGPQIGKWGQLQEWADDLDDPKSQHRHTSHLIAVFPGRQITPTATPELAKAAAISLTARGETGDSRREWAWVFRSAVWARLAEPEKAYHCLAGLLTFNMMPNLFQTHPPFVIDGSFGYAAAVCEMLLQSHAGEIELLPALPKAWPAGKVTGLRARGGFFVDIQWQDGKVVSYRIASTEAREVKVRVNGNVKTLMSDEVTGSSVRKG